MQIVCLAAEPASIFYIATGFIGLLFARFRTSTQLSESSIMMHFCRRSTRKKLLQIKLT
jgi:hypothetical protein